MSKANKGGGGVGEVLPTEFCDFLMLTQLYNILIKHNSALKSGGAKPYFQRGGACPMPPVPTSLCMYSSLGKNK